MALTVVSQPDSIWLTTFDRVARELDLPTISGGVKKTISDMIQDASQMIADECGRPFFGVGTYTETLQGSGSQYLSVTCVPILTITQITQDGEVIDPTDPDEGYTVEQANVGAIYRVTGWRRTAALLAWGAEAYASQYILPGGTNTMRYQVNYTAGYTLPDSISQPPYTPPALGQPCNLPTALQRACLETVKTWWHARDRDPAMSSIKVDNNTQIAYRGPDTGVLPANVLGMIRDHRRVN